MLYIVIEKYKFFDFIRSYVNLFTNKTFVFYAPLSYGFPNMPVTNMLVWSWESSHFFLDNYYRLTYSGISDFIVISLYFRKNFNITTQVIILSKIYIIDFCMWICMSSVCSLLLDLYVVSRL